jgi:5'-deoxynucleotidase YfbR-like HD superfamily hydrolase
LRAGEAAAEAERLKEKAPLDKQIADIQDRYNEYIAPLKNKKPGKVPMAVSALKALLTPYLQKQEDEKRAIAEAARKEAELEGLHRCRCDPTGRRQRPDRARIR